MKNDRYSKHHKLSGFGEAAQTRLLQSSVLVIGAGGLGCPALQYLVAAGVGKVGIVDHDRIERSNLQRQTLFATHEAGLLKAAVAARKLRLLNPEIDIRAYPVWLSTKNAVDLAGPYDVVLDCTDNFVTRYLLSDLCRLLHIPLVFGAVYQYEGQLAVFNVANEKGIKTTYRHLFPSPPTFRDAPDCNEAGVLGVLPGIIGTLQATEAIKLLSGVGKVMSNQLMTINLLDNRSNLLDIPHTLSEDAGPASLSAFKHFDYGCHCGTKENLLPTISPAQFEAVLQKEEVLVIDVRNADEQPRLPFDHLQLPLNQLKDNVGKVHKKNVVVVCQSGKRSQVAGNLLREKLGTGYHISHLEGGITALKTLVYE